MSPERRILRVPASRASAKPWSLKVPLRFRLARACCSKAASSSWVGLRSAQLSAPSDSSQAAFSAGMPARAKPSLNLLVPGTAVGARELRPRRASPVEADITVREPPVRTCADVGAADAALACGDGGVSAWSAARPAESDGPTIFIDVSSVCLSASA